jgi:hypothetical protein
VLSRDPDAPGPLPPEALVGPTDADLADDSD